jgi:hypothetical protein
MLLRHPSLTPSFKKFPWLEPSKLFSCCLRACIVCTIIGVAGVKARAGLLFWLVRDSQWPKIERTPRDLSPYVLVMISSQYPLAPKRTFAMAAKDFPANCVWDSGLACLAARPPKRHAKSRQYRRSAQLAFPPVRGAQAAMPPARPRAWAFRPNHKNAGRARPRWAPVRCNPPRPAPQEAASASVTPDRAAS